MITLSRYDMVLGSLLAAVFLLAGTNARADATCASFVSKIAAARAATNGTSFEPAILVVGGAVHTRGGAVPSAFHDFFMNERHVLSSAPIPSAVAASRANADARFVPASSTNPFASVVFEVREEFPGRSGPATDRSTLTIRSTGDVTTQSHTWTPDVVVLPNAKCVQVETVPAAHGAAALPVMLVTGSKTFSGYGTDSFHFAVTPTWVPVLQ